MWILGHEYTLCSLSKNASHQKLGTSGFHTLQIELPPSYVPESVRISTLIHETLEQLNDQLEIGLEHRQITALEAGLYQVLTDNGIDLTPLLKEVEEG